MVSSLLFQLLIAGGAQIRVVPPDIVEIERRVRDFAPDERYPDDPFVLVAVQEALSGFKEGNGGIGACLMDMNTLKVVERGHNRQFEPYFRSDLHAEMDLLTRYEERVKARKLDNASVPQAEQRKIKGLVLYTSIEPCPMCLARIINVGIKRTYFAAPDPSGGMAGKIQSLPAFWQELATGSIFEPARCSPELTAIAKSLFRPMSRK